MYVLHLDNYGFLYPILFQKYEFTCAVCRSKLWTRKPLLPNFSVDNLVHQHLQILAKSGRPEWQEKGYKTIEWNKRLEFVPVHHAAVPYSAFLDPGKYRPLPELPKKN